MDIERCAKLHNEILKFGWQGSGRPLDDFHPKSWFEFHGEEANAVRDSLSPHLVRFLEQAWEVGDDHSFFYYVNGLSYPSNLFTNSLHNGNGDEKRFLTLYAANDLADHPDGLIFDQEQNTAIIQMTIEDSQTAHNGRQTWYPLETVLDAWLDMIQVGKIRAVSEDIDCPNPKYDPWINVPYSEDMLQETIVMFDKLVDAVESRMPETPQAATVLGFVDDEDITSSTIPQGFAREFIHKARRPMFQYIAPGLAVPTSSTFPEQPFSPVAPDPPPEEEDDILALPPILLFRSKQRYTAPPDAPITGSGLPFSWPYSQVSQYPAGLYLAPVDRESNNPFEDECKLVLPFAIGENGFARTSDGACFGENTEVEDVNPQNTVADLYQPGYQPFTEMHGVRLVKVLESWLGMVQRGDWDVDQDGVVGSMDEWRKVDTNSHWEKFVVPVGW